MHSLQLESPYFRVDFRPEQGTWDLSAVSGARITGARMGARLRTQEGLKVWDGRFSEAPIIDPARGRGLHRNVRSASLRCARDGLAIGLDFEACLDRPLLLWRLRAANETDRPVALDSFEMLQAGQRELAAEGAGGVRLHDRPGDVGFFSNGFQSWSYAGALRPEDRMPRTRLGLILWPENPDTPVPSRPGEFVAHMFGVLTDRTQRAGMLFGFLSQRETYGTLAVSIAGAAPSLRLWAHGDGVELAPGASLQTDWACAQSVALDDPDPLAAYLDAVAAENSVEHLAAAPVGWCSWYKYMKAVGGRDLERNLARAAELREHVPLTVFQLDDGYQAPQAELLETNERFPRGLQPVAEMASARGFLPGLWLAPFITAPTSAVARNHPAWILRGESGRAANAGSTWAVRSRGLDVTHPEVIEHTRRLIRAAVKECGFRYLKLDFLYAGVLVGRRHDPTRTRAQALDAILRAIREEAGPDVTLLGCGCPVGSGIGVFDAMRIGTDVAPAWHPRYFGTELFFRPEPTFPSVRNVLRNTLARMPFHGRWWVNDPDCLLVRQEDTHLTPAEVQSLTTILSMTGGSLLVSDDLTELSDERVEWLARLLPTLKGRARVLDALETSEPSEVALRQSGAAGDWMLLARLNWSDRPRSLPLDLKRFGLPESPAYLWADPWAGEAGVLAGRVLDLPAVPAHGIRLLAVREAKGAPQWIGDTLHISQGQVVIEWHAGANELSAVLSLGRPRKGGAWIWLPGEPQRAALDGKPVTVRSLGGGIYAFDLSIQTVSELAIRW